MQATDYCFRRKSFEMFYEALTRYRVSGFGFRVSRWAYEFGKRSKN